MCKALKILFLAVILVLSRVGTAETEMNYPLDRSAAISHGVIITKPYCSEGFEQYLYFDGGVPVGVDGSQEYAVFNTKDGSGWLFESLVTADLGRNIRFGCRMESLVPENK